MSRKHDPGRPWIVDGQEQCNEKQAVTAALCSEQVHVENDHRQRHSRHPQLGRGLFAVDTVAASLLVLSLVAVRMPDNAPPINVVRP